MNYNYSLRYEIKIESDENGYTKDQSEGKGLTDCLLAFSVLLPETGEYSQAVVFNWNGKEKRPFTQKELFKLWMSLGLSLHDNNGLKGWHAEVITLHAKMIRSLFRPKEE